MTDFLTTVIFPRPHTTQSGWMSGSTDTTNSQRQVPIAMGAGSNRSRGIWLGDVRYQTLQHPTPLYTQPLSNIKLLMAGTSELRSNLPNVSGVVKDIRYQTIPFNSGLLTQPLSDIASHLSAWEQLRASFRVNSKPLSILYQASSMDASLYTYPLSPTFDPKIFAPNANIQSLTSPKLPALYSGYRDTLSLFYSLGVDPAILFTPTGQLASSYRIHPVPSLTILHYTKPQDSPLYTVPLNPSTFDISSVAPAYHLSSSFRNRLHSLLTTHHKTILDNAPLTTQPLSDIPLFTSPLYQLLRSIRMLDGVPRIINYETQPFNSGLFTQTLADVQLLFTPSTQLSNSFLSLGPNLYPPNRYISMMGIQVLSTPYRLFYIQRMF